MSEAERYSITVRRVTLDSHDVWRASVKEIPDLVEFADTREEATELALDSIVGLMEAAREEGRAFPAPAEDEETFSGRVTVRMPPSLHRRLAELAESEQTSLNQYIVLLLGWNASSAMTREQTWKPLVSRTWRTYETAFDVADWTLKHGPAVRDANEVFRRHVEHVLVGSTSITKQLDVGAPAFRKFLDNVVVVGSSQSAASAFALSNLKMNEPLLPSIAKRFKGGKAHGTK